MPDVKVTDDYANIYQIVLTESAPATLTYFEINLGLTLFQKKAILVNRIVVDWTQATLEKIIGVSDTVIVGLCQSNIPASIALTDSSTIWKAQKLAHPTGTPAEMEILDVVQVFDLTRIPGGGEFIVPTPLYGAIQAASIATATTVTVRMYFQVVDLKPDQYFELLESRHYYG